MSTAEKRTALYRLIDEADETFIEAAYLLLANKQAKDEDPIVGYETDGTPVRASDFLDEAEIAIAEAKAGKGISVEELEKRSEQWLARTR